MRKSAVTLVFLAGLLLTCSSVELSYAQIPVYENTFEPGGESTAFGVSAVWNNSSRATTPGTVSHPADRFLGELSNTEVRLLLGNLPSHSRIHVWFDLFLIRSWDGNVVDRNGNRIDISGPDVFEFNAGGDLVLLHTTFRNGKSNCTTPPFDDPIICTQSYPDDFYPPDQVTYNPPRTGATESDTLGFGNCAGCTCFVQDAVYRLSYTFDHFGNTAALHFIASGLQYITNESWGIDDVTVAVSGTGIVPTSTSTPTPVTTSVPTPTPSFTSLPLFTRRPTPTPVVLPPGENLFECTLYWYRWVKDYRIDAPEFLNMVNESRRKNRE